MAGLLVRRDYAGPVISDNQRFARSKMPEAKLSAISSLRRKGEKVKTVKYNDIRGSIKCGDRMEFASKSILGNVIRWFTKETVNHTALCMSIDEYAEYCGNRKFLLEAEADGIVLHTISKALCDYSGRVFYTPVLPQFEEKRKLIADWALQQVGTKYDYGSLFKNMIGRVNAEMGKLFCSEFFFIALVQAGCIPGAKMSGSKIVDLNGAPVESPRPGEFDRFPIFGETVEIVQ